MRGGFVCGNIVCPRFRERSVFLYIRVPDRGHGDFQA
jgi:hypothetical protein